MSSLNQENEILIDFTNINFPFIGENSEAIIKLYDFGWVL